MINKEDNIPQHPGYLLKQKYLVSLELTITQVAHHLGVTRNTLSKLLNGHSAISPEMAIRLSMALNTTPQLWLYLQLEYDLWKTQKKLKGLHLLPLRRKSVPDSS